MGNNISTIKVNYEDTQEAIKDKKTLIINTLNTDNQSCLIERTTSIQSEVKILNESLSRNKDVRIIIYGLNANDDTTLTKYEQLIKLGFYNVFIYPGGMFEWLLLQDIYGEELFATTKKELDILKYKAQSVINMRFIENGYS
jgi:hypothetical protein